MDKYKYQYDDAGGAHFLDILERTVNTKKDEVFATWYNSRAKPTNTYTFNEIWDEAGAFAHYLRIELKLKKGDRVILCYYFGLQFFAAFLGCLRAGIVAVLIYPPAPNNLPVALPKMTKIIEDSDAKFVLVDDIVYLLRLNPVSKSRKLWPQNVSFKVHPKKKFTVQKKNNISVILQENPITSSDLAFLQYTSGSTGTPKGVMVTFGALNANVNNIISGAINIINDVNQTLDSRVYSKEDIIGLSWLPQYHDMGLVYAIVAPFAGGWNCNMMSPFDFIKNPLLWLQLMSDLRVKWSVAPNFAFKLVARKFLEAKKKLGTQNPIPDLDLSSIVFLQNAAEPIQNDVRDVFNETFGSYGLHTNWFGAGYGLAESVVYVTHIHEFKLSTLQPTKGQSNVAVGHRKNFSKGQIAKIVDPVTCTELSDNEIGELWLSGPSITAGYFGQPKLTSEVYHATIEGHDQVFLRTGDLAFFEDDYLYICGRQKDLVIVNGVNHYPQDIENAAQSIPGVRPGCVAAFSSNDTSADGDLEVVFEVRNNFVHSVVDVVDSVRMKIIEQIGIVPTRVVAIKERTILKTTSGKIQRKANRIALHNDSHCIIYEYNSIDKLGSNEMTQHNDEEGDYESFDRIMVSFFGSNIDTSQTWDELGLSSMASVQLRDEISASFAITLDPECFEINVSPDALKAYIIKNQGVPLEVDLPSLYTLYNNNLSWCMLGCVQVFLSIILILLFTSSIVPAWYVGQLLATMDAYSTLKALDGITNIRWAVFPIVVPMWMLSFSLLVISLKWAVIWKYKEGIVSIPSFLYLRWWFVDRAIALWEIWVGQFILDTPLINVFYIFMGTKMHRNVSIKSFIREFDLVDIQKGTSLQHQVHCRKFGKWNDKITASLRFRHVKFGANCTVKGMISLGASVGQNSSVEKLSVVVEGGKVPANCQVSGNPAFINGHATDKNDNQTSCLFGLLKLIWLGFELYLFFGQLLLGQYLWVPYLPYKWRYAKVLQWSLMFMWFNVLSIGTSIILKWTFIGKRSPGPVRNSLLQKIADWAVDWHFRKTTSLIHSLTFNSRLWNIVLMMHGMDIDTHSKVVPQNFVPSNFDLISVRNSFVSTATFSTKENNHYHPIKIQNSNIGFWVHLRAINELNISGATVPPLTHVSCSIVSTEQDSRVFVFSSWELVKDESLKSVGYFLSFVLLFVTVIPSYEVWMNVYGNPSSTFVAVLALASVLILLTLTWTSVLVCVQYVSLINSSDRPGIAKSNILYALYLSMAFAYQEYSFLYTLLGTPAFNIIVKFLGTKLNGRALLFPQRMYEFPYITIADKTIVDNSHVSGHYAVYNDVNLGPTNISGVLHEGSYATNTSIVKEESEAWRSFVGMSEIGSTRRLATSDDTYSPEIDEAMSFQK